MSLMSQQEVKRNIILGGCLVLVFIILMCWIFSTINQHFEEYMYGFWCGETLDGPCILHLDKDQIRLIEPNALSGVTSIKKGTYNLSSRTMFNMNLRKYSLSINDLTSKSKIGRKLSESNLCLDLYPIEGTCIIHNDTGDILTLIKDNKSTIDLLL